MPVIVLTTGDDTYDGAEQLGVTVYGLAGNDSLAGSPFVDELDGGRATTCWPAGPATTCLSAASASTHWTAAPAATACSAAPATTC